MQGLGCPFIKFKAVAPKTKMTRALRIERQVVGNCFESMNDDNEVAGKRFGLVYLMPGLAEEQEGFLLRSPQTINILKNVIPFQ